jgi:hypothetical protein
MNVFSSLEYEYYQKYNIYIDKLLLESISDVDENDFLNLVKVSLENKELKEFVISSFLDKIKTLKANVISEQKLQYLMPTSMLKLATVNMLRFLCKTKSYETLNALESLFLKSGDFKLFFLLIKEKINAKLSIQNSELAFLSLISYEAHPRPTFDDINEYLEIIKQDHNFILSYFLNQEDREFHLTPYIEMVARADLICLFELLPSVIEAFETYDTNYYTLIGKILLFSNLHLDSMLVFPYTFSELEELLLKADSFSVTASLNYIKYLFKSQPERFKKFEQKFLDASSGYLIISYLELFPEANKREILKRLIQFEDDSLLVRFFELCPKYRNLITML